MAALRARRLAPFAQNLALALATVVLTLGAGEGVARIFDHAPPPRPVAGYITTWNDGEFYTVNSAATGWPPWEDYNHDGVRDREHALAPAPGVRRVMCLGDSVTLGYGLRPPEAFPQVLQDLLDARGARAEVFNVALSGWSTRQERIAYERICRKYRPDQVVVGVCLNDIPEIHNNLARPPRFLQVLHARSALVRLLIGARRREIHDVEEMFTSPSSPNVRDAMSRFFAEVAALRREASRDGASVALAILPFRLQVTPGAPPPIVQQEILRFCAEEKLACLDLLPALRPLGERAYIDYDHFSAEGARQVAEAVADTGWFGRGDAATPREAPRDAASGGAAEDGPAALTPALVARLAGSDPAGRAAAARALGNRGDPQAAPALLRALDDASPDVRSAAAWALGKIGPKARAAAPALARHLADPAGEVRWRAADALAAVEPDASVAPILVSIVADPAGPGRAAAASALGRLGPAAVAEVPELAAALADPRDEVRAKAAWALGEIGPGAKGAVQALVQAASSPAVGWYAIDALGKIGPDARLAVPALQAALADSNANVRWRAAAALGRIGPDARVASTDLARRLADATDNVRRTAAKALGQVGAPAAEAAAGLTRALGDPDSRVRAEAANSLTRLQDLPGRDVTDALVRALGDPDALVRASAARALGRLEPTASVEAGLAVAARDPDPAVRTEALRALKGRRRTR